MTARSNEIWGCATSNVIWGGIIMEVYSIYDIISLACACNKKPSKMPASFTATFPPILHAIQQYISEHAIVNIQWREICNIKFIKSMQFAWWGRLRFVTGEQVRPGKTELREETGP